MLRYLSSGQAGCQQAEWQSSVYASKDRNTYDLAQLVDGPVEQASSVFLSIGLATQQLALPVAFLKCHDICLDKAAQ